MRALFISAFFTSMMLSNTVHADSSTQDTQKALHVLQEIFEKEKDNLAVQFSLQLFNKLCSQYTDTDRKKLCVLSSAHKQLKALSYCTSYKQTVNEDDYTVCNEDFNFYHSKTLDLLTNGSISSKDANACIHESIYMPNRQPYASYFDTSVSVFKKLGGIAYILEQPIDPTSLFGCLRTKL